jgi:O-antigen ligase
MQSVENKYGRLPSHRGRIYWWIVVPLAILGSLALSELFQASSHFNHSGLVLIAGAVLGIPVLVLLGFALRQGLGHARTLVSSLKWWHLLWAMLLFGALTFRIRGASEIASEPLDAWAVFRIAIDMLVAFVLLVRLTLRRTHWPASMLRGVVGVLTVYGVVCLASTAWSVFPPWTFYKSWEYLIDIALVAAILESVNSTEDLRSLFNWTWTLYGVLLLSVWKDVLLFPQEALHGQVLQSGAALGIRLEGEVPAISSNDVGTFSALIALISLARLFPSTGRRSHTSWYIVLLAGSMVTMVLAQTRSAVLGVMFGGFVILLFSKRGGRLGALLTFVVAPVVALFTMGGVIWSFLERGQSEAQIATLSSRAQWWGFAWQTYLERPLTGFGAYAGGRFAVLAKLGLGETSTMHSDYLEVLVGTSIWGMIPLVIALAATWWLILRYARHPWNPQERQLAVEAIVILAMLTLRSVFNNMFTWHPPLPFLAILGYAEYLRRERQAAVRVAAPVLRSRVVDEPDPQLELIFR